MTWQVVTSIASHCQIVADVVSYPQPVRPGPAGTVATCRSEMTIAQESPVVTPLSALLREGSTAEHREAEGSSFMTELLSPTEARTSDALSDGHRTQVGGGHVLETAAKRADGRAHGIADEYVASHSSLPFCPWAAAVRASRSRSAASSSAFGASVLLTGLARLMAQLNAVLSHQVHCLAI